MDKKFFDFLSEQKINNFFSRTLSEAKRDLHIDLDETITSIVRRVYHQRKSDGKLRAREINTPPEKFFSIFNITLEKELIRILNRYKFNYNVIYLYISGIHNADTIQRMRRNAYYHSSTPILFEILDENSILPGTEFMEKVNSSLKEIIKKVMTELSIERIVYSDYSNPGNTHDKIFENLKKSSISNVIVGFSIENFTSSLFYNDLYLADLSLYNDYINMTSCIKFVDNPKNFCIIMSLYRSQIRSKFFNTFDFLKRLMDNSKGKNLTNSNGINFKEFSILLTRIKEYEKNYYAKDAGKKYEIASVIYEKSMSNRRFSYSKFKELWYNFIFDAETDEELSYQIFNMIEDYIANLSNISSYLSGEKYDVNYTYKYLYYPLLDDIVSVMSDIKSQNKEDYSYDYKYNYMDQLVAILPRSSNALLPRDIRGIVLEGSALADLYPTSIPVYNLAMDLKNKPLLLMPIVSMNRIHNIILNKKNYNVDSQITTFVYTPAPKCGHCLMLPSRGKEEEVKREITFTDESNIKSEDFTVVNFPERRDLLIYIEFLTKYLPDDLSNVVIIHDFDLPVYFKGVTYVKKFLNYESGAKLSLDFNDKFIIMIVNFPFYTYLDVLEELKPDVSLFINLSLPTKRQNITFVDSDIYNGVWGNPYLVVDTTKDLNNIELYDVDLINESINYFNYKIRPKQYKGQISGPDYFDSCYDCTTELLILSEWLKRKTIFNVNLNDIPSAIKYINNIVGDKEVKVHYKGKDIKEKFTDVVSVLRSM